MLRNKNNGKKYIGQSLDIERRWALHRQTFRKKRTVLARAFRKHGVENFEFIVLEECAPDELGEKEIHYMELHQPEYNMVGGGGGVPGQKLSEETKRRLSEKGKAQWLRKTSEEKMFCLSHQLIGPTPGKPRSALTKNRLREAALGQFANGMPQTTKEKISRGLLSSDRVWGPTRRRKVAKLDQHGVALETFEMITEAAASVERDPTGVHKVCAGKQKSCGGFGWKYCD